MTAMRLSLTRAQRSALECRDLEGTLLEALWDGRGFLYIPDAHAAEGLAEELTDESNAEDAQAELPGEDPELRRYARNAALALANLSVKVARLARSLDEVAKDIPPAIEG